MKTIDKSILNRILLALAATIVLVYFYPRPEANRFNYEEGKPWNYAKLIAPFDIPIHPDSVTMLRIRDTLDAKFVPVFTLNPRIADSVLALLPPSPGAHFNATLAKALRQRYAKGIVDDEVYKRIRAGELPKIRVIEGNTSSQISTSGMRSVRSILHDLDSVVEQPDLRAYIFSSGLERILVPNYEYNETESDRYYEREYLTLTADRGMIMQGQTIIDKGAIVSPQDFTNLRTYEEMLADNDAPGSQSGFLLLLGQFLFVGMMMTVLMFYFHNYAPEIYGNMRSILFVVCLVTVFVLLSMVTDHFLNQGLYIMPMMIVPILMLVFFDGRSALLVSIVTTLLCAGMAAFAMEYIFLQFAASCAAIMSLRELSRRSQLLRTSFVVLAVYLVSYVALELLFNGSFEGFSWHLVLFLVINSALTSMAYILMSAIERMFGFVSVVTLVELADINNPILLRLSNECPGTFQHSIAVSNLASDAAQRIGADVQLVRAGSLYHDIGKLNNPAFFTENQHGVNPHDALPPERSAAIVIGHVADGLKLADKAKLPTVIRDFIREHHGAGKAKYFYFTYCRNHPGEEVDPAPFTYPGPNPQTRETSLLMMADAVEAASRSLKEHTREAISDLVNKIVDGQIADGLHNESTLTFHDISVIKEAFIKRLMTIYHSRIAYPKAPANAETAQ